MQDALRNLIGDARTLLAAGEHAQVFDRLKTGFHASVDALVSIGMTHCLDAILKLAADPEIEVRRAAMSALANANGDRARRPSNAYCSMSVRLCGLRSVGPSGTGIEN